MAASLSDGERSSDGAALAAALAWCPDRRVAATVLESSTVMDDPCGEQSVDGGSASHCVASVAATILESCGSVDRALQDNVLHGDPFDSRALQDNVLHGDPFESRALPVHSAASSSNVARLVGTAINDFCGHDDFPTLPNIPVPQWIRFASPSSDNDAQDPGPLFVPSPAPLPSMESPISVTSDAPPPSVTPIQGSIGKYIPPRAHILTAVSAYEDELSGRAPHPCPPGRPTRKRLLPPLTSHPVACPSTSRPRPVGVLWLRPSRPPTPPSPSMPARSVTPPSPSHPSPPPALPHAPTLLAPLGTYPFPAPLCPPPLPSPSPFTTSPLPPLHPRPLPRRLSPPARPSTILGFPSTISSSTQPRPALDLPSTHMSVTSPEPFLSPSQILPAPPVFFPAQPRPVLSLCSL